MEKINKVLLSGSLVLLICFNLFNILNFIFNISMAHFLSLEEYGVLSTLMYLIVLFSIFNESIQTVITKYSVPENSPSKLKNILKKSLSKSISYSIILYIFYALISIYLSRLFNIDYLLLILSGAIIITSFTLPVVRGLLQGRKRFFSLGLNLIVEGTIKLFLSIFLVILGFRVYGAMVAVIIGAIVALLFSFISIKDIISSKERESKTEGILSYTKPVFIITLSILLFMSLDILIARAVFDPRTAGIYALLSTISKIIFLGTQPISKAMFPLSAEQNKSKNIFSSSLILVLLLIVISLLAILVFPNLIIYIFSGKQIENASTSLFFLSLSMSLLSITNLILLYKLSIGKIRNYLIILIPVLLEAIILIILSQSLLSFSIALSISSLIILLTSIFFPN